jgi:hypothetical protein
MSETDLYNTVIIVICEMLHKKQWLDGRELNICCSSKNINQAFYLKFWNTYGCAFKRNHGTPFIRKIIALDSKKKTVTALS